MPIQYLFNILHVDSKLINQYEQTHIDIVDVDYVPYSEKVSILTETDWLNIDGHGSLISSVTYAFNIHESPVLMLIWNDLAHINYNLDENGKRIPTTNDVTKYIGEYLFSEKVILYHVDKILEHDPNAIIIIQGDHGPHSGNYEGYTEFFASDPRYSEYKGHVLSAVRIPEQYQTEDYPESIQNPLNIVRYLVNSYVGENYEYIPWEEA